MDLKNTGKFIAEQRKIKGLTQAQLAEKLKKAYPVFETKYIECGEVYSYTDTKE